MLEKLDFMMRFWDLKARHDSLGTPLSRVERVELLSLLGLMATDDPLPAAGPPPRSEHAIEAQVTAPGRFIAVEIRMVCARGLVVACMTPLPEGQITVVRLADDECGVEYTVPCVVEWAFEGSPSAMALRVDGTPARMAFVATECLGWGSAIGWTEEPAVERRYA
jgi:hypothetical protein